MFSDNFFKKVEKKYLSELNDQMFIDKQTHHMPQHNNGTI